MPPPPLDRYNRQFDHGSLTHFRLVRTQKSQTKDGHPEFSLESEWVYDYPIGIDARTNDPFKAPWEGRPPGSFGDEGSIDWPTEYILDDIVYSDYEPPQSNDPVDKGEEDIGTIDENNVWPYDDPCIFPKNSKSQKDRVGTKPGDYETAEMYYWEQFFGNPANKRKNRVSEQGENKFERWHESWRLFQGLKDENNPIRQYIEGEIDDIIAKVARDNYTFEQVFELMFMDKEMLPLWGMDYVATKQMIDVLQGFIYYLRNSATAGGTIPEDLNTDLGIAQFLKRVLQDPINRGDDSWIQMFGAYNDTMYYEMLEQAFNDLYPDPSVYKDCKDADRNSRLTTMFKKFKGSAERLSSAIGGDPSTLNWGQRNGGGKSKRPRNSKGGGGVVMQNQTGNPLYQVKLPDLLLR